MIRSWILTCTLVLPWVAADDARAQAGASALPVPLVTALMSGTDRMASQSPQYFVATLPTGFPAALVPSGPVAIVGGMRTGTQIVAVLADSTRRLAAVLEELFEASGYKRPPASPGSGFSSPSGPYAYFCKDSVMISAEPLTGLARDMAKVTYRIFPGRPACFDFSVRPSVESRLVLPPLKPMPNVQVYRSGGGGGNAEVESHATMSAADGIDPAAVLAHYTTQLVQAGWKTGSPAVGARVAAQFFEATDSAGKQWQGTLMVSGTHTSLTLSLLMRPR